MTCENSPPKGSPQTELFPMSSSEGSPAKTSHSRERARALLVSGADCGSLTPVLLANFDQGLSSWRTSERCFLEGWMPFSEPWPRSGMMRNGIAYQLPPLAPLTAETDCGLLPTPRKNDAQKRGNFDIDNSRNGFPAAVKRVFLPTISKQEPKGSSRKRYLGSPHFRGAKMSEGLRTCEDDPIYLHPSFAEAVMGFPIGWTALDPLATP
jgi:hypothetical protein